MGKQKIEVGDVFTHKETGSKADPYHGITLPEPPAGYRLAKWGEDVPEKSLWWDCDDQGKNGTWDSDWRSPHSKWPWFQWQGCLTQPSMAIFAIPLDQPSVSDEFRKASEIEANTPINSPVPLQPGCKWVKANWALQPTDFMLLSGHRVTAEQAGHSWKRFSQVCYGENIWQRPQLLDTDLLYTMKCIKTAVHNLPESDKQKYIFEMLQVQSQAGKLLSEIRERAEAAAKAEAELKATEGGQP